MTGVQTCALPICFPVTISWYKANAGNKVDPLIVEAKKYKIGDEISIIDEAKNSNSITKTMVISSLSKMVRDRPMGIRSRSIR